MKRIILTLLLAALMAPAGAYAQRVYKDGSNRIILDLTTAAGMPAGAQSAVSKTAVLNALTPSNTTGPLAGNDANGIINATVYQKLEIAPYDINTAGQISATGTFTMNWVTAWNACKGATYNGTGWRLPTQRELQLMYVFFNPKNSANSAMVTALGMTAFSSTHYWSATEHSSRYSWNVPFSAGYMLYIYKDDSSRARCVREVTP